MKLFHPFSLRLIFTGSFLAGLSLNASEQAGSIPEQNAGKLHYADVVQAAARFDQVILWEGLPSPFEKDLLARELARKKTFLIGDQHFYSLPIPLTDEEWTTLSDAVLKHRENFAPWSGMKQCGGFHADYAVEWRYQGTTMAQALFCFSCDEVQFRVGDRVEQADLSPGGITRFRALLLSHDQQRPFDITVRTKPPAAAPFVLPPPTP
jgi:hypothetical protein